ncbi:MAG: hypothetical protein F4X48_05525 [Acidimicrobiia bacterium]|nr:hypothetical protein [Acidimicrobiia bacterium]MYC58021.1 hypothetical protein [Acidimicrobiia bacterium]MYI30806.1 hypothetical protein [Acidimicrobiia bacterium]
MASWKWEGWEALDAWEIDKDDSVVDAVYGALFAALDDDLPGSEVPFASPPTLRILYTPRAAIYFNALPQTGKLVLSSIVSR